MEILRTLKDVRQYINPIAKSTKQLALVPTMGYLHEGHFSLIRKARSENDQVVVSIFVNPIQFGPNEDLDKYPKDHERDLDYCDKLGVDAVFMPDASEMYHNLQTTVSIDALSHQLCGQQRPTHFAGVCTVVAKLFNLIKPDRAYFGQKDAQQLAILKKMVVDLNFDVEIIGCPIVREADGLAMSSRNSYLSETERQRATCLYKAITQAQQLMAPGISSQAIIDQMTAIISETPGTIIDYIQIVDANTLEPVSSVQGDVLVALAVKLGKTRLIDNFTYQMKG
ncbi:pantoate--beta-alanine ligase [Streptococcus phocae]|uniref:Pantothenate synthetase n=1 Tax=Streptococcus phocae TaxID=119224 RepID=A0A0P6S705_9STRE|nr:pantoate--beta-alanine ligase [Streptococcus phocae]KPJ23000.1 pantoate--beta-alanine ligase [Streptococcus phocae]